MPAAPDPSRRRLSSGFSLMDWLLCGSAFYGPFVRGIGGACLVAVATAALSANVWAQTAESGGGFGDQVENIRIGVLAEQGIEPARLRWQAMAFYLSEALGYPFEIVPAGFEEIAVLVHHGLIEFLITDAGSYVRLARHDRLSCLLTLLNRLPGGQTSRQVGSVVFSRAVDRAPRRLSEIASHHIAAVNPTSFSGWLMVQRELDAIGIADQDLETVHFVGTHDAVVDAVKRGGADVGIVRTGVLERLAAEGLVELAAFSFVSHFRRGSIPVQVTTRLYPEWPLAMVEGVPDDLAKGVLRALLAMEPDHPAATAAGIAGWTAPASYSDVEQALFDMDLMALPVVGSGGVTGFFGDHWLPFTLTSVAILGLGLAYLFRTKGLKRQLAQLKARNEISEMRLNATFNQAAVGLAHVTPDGRFAKVNTEFRELTGYSEAELRHLTLNDITRPEDLARELKLMQDVRQGVQDSFELDKNLVVKDGSTVWGLFSLSAVRDDRQSLVLLMMAFIDGGRLKSLQRDPVP